MQIIDILEHFPGEAYATGELRSVMAPSLARWGIDETFSDEFFVHLGVASRHMVVDPANPDRWWTAHRGRSPIAREGARCYQRLMDGRKPLGPRDRLIVVSNVYDTTSPGLGIGVLTALATENAGLVAPSLLQLGGDGCSGFISAMREADVWLHANPGTRVVILSCEVSSPYFWSPVLLETLESELAKADPAAQIGAKHRLRGLCIQRFLFGDGCVAAMCVDDDSPDGIPMSMFHRWTNLRPDDRDLLKLIGVGTEQSSYPTFGYFLQQPKALIARLQADYLPRAARVLSALGRRPRAFAVHTGSGPILDLVQARLSLTDDEIAPSRALLMSRGNLNSATGAAILASLRDKSDIFCVFFGVGFTLQIAGHDFSRDSAQA